MSGGGGVFVGYECKPCGIRVGTMATANIGDGSLAPRCEKGHMMTPVEGPDAPELLANVYCRKCNSMFGAISSGSGPITACPNCHEPL
jgi:hypothetical protein